MPWDEIIEGLLKQVRLQTGWLRLRPLFSRILDGCYCVRNNRIGEMSSVHQTRAHSLDLMQTAAAGGGHEGPGLSDQLGLVIIIMPLMLSEASRFCRLRER